MAISSGLYTLAGVVIGGALTTSTQVYLERRRERREERAEIKAVRLAKRQISAELFDKAAAVNHVSSDVSAAGVIGLLSASGQWERYASVLAADECYTAVQHAYTRANLLEELMGKEESDGCWIKAEAARTYDAIGEALRAIGPDALRMIRARDQEREAETRNTPGKIADGGGHEKRPRKAQ